MGTIKEVVYPEGRAPRRMSSKVPAEEVGRKKDPGTSSLQVGDTTGQVTGRPGYRRQVWATWL